MIICHGKLDEKEMRKQRYNIEDLMEELRVCGCGDISQIEYALLETSGQISVIPKTKARPLTVEDMNIKPEQEQIPHTIIYDGVLDKKELKKSGKDENWLDKKLRAKGIKRYSDVFIAATDTKGELFMQIKEKKK